MHVRPNPRRTSYTRTSLWCRSSGAHARLRSSSLQAQQGARIGGEDRLSAGVVESGQQAELLDLALVAAEREVGPEEQARRPELPRQRLQIGEAVARGLRPQIRTRLQ